MAATINNGSRLTQEAIAAADSQQAEFQKFLKSDEYLAAVRAETEGRDQTFVDVAVPVCGVRLRQMSSQDLLNLSLVRSPLLASGFLSGALKPIDYYAAEAVEGFMKNRIVIRPRDLAAFIWMQSVDFVPRSGNWLQKLRARWRWFMCVRKCRRLKYSEANEAIRGYVNDALMDKPAGSGRGGSAVASWVASSVAFIASKFHWSEKEILTMPIARLFQYERSILSAGGMRSALTNRSDALKSKFLRDFKQRQEARK